MPLSGVSRNAALIASLLAVLTACSREGPIPAVPAIQLSGFDPEVRDAIQTAHQQAVAQPESGQASGRLGMVLQAHAIYEPALQSYERAMRLEPKEFAWRYYRAVVYQQLSELDKALEALTAALQIRPDYVAAILRKGDLLFQLGRFAESGAVYKALLSDDPGSAMALYGTARVKYAQHDMAAAEDFYTRACRAYQNFGAAYYGLAMAERSLGKETESARDLELAQRYGSDHPPVADALGDQVSAMATGVYYHLTQGDQLARKGRAEEAARLNESVLQRDPENLTVLMNLLYLARFTGGMDSHLDDLYARAQRINPQVPLIYDYYGAALARQGKYDGAAAAFRKAIDLRPDYAEAHALLAAILERQNRAAEAMEQYQRALAAQPSNPPVQMSLWRLQIIAGRGREVIPQVQAALPLEDQYSALRLVLLGEAYRTVGDAGQARQYLEQALNRARSEGPPNLVAQIEQELQQVAARP